LKSTARTRKDTKSHRKNDTYVYVPVRVGASGLKRSMTTGKSWCFGAKEVYVYVYDYIYI
jgi:hypothetical protein